MSPPGAIPLGAWEKAWVLEHLKDDASCVNWLVELNQAPDPSMVASALEAIRPGFPLYFSAVQVEEDGVSLVAHPRVDSPIDAYVVEHADVEGGGPCFARRLANTRLDPLDGGLLRCHCVSGPVSMLALQVAHVAGDAYTNHRFRTAFAAALHSLGSGRRPVVTAPQAAHAVPIEEVLARLPAAPRQLEDVVRRARRLRVPRMTVAAGYGGDRRFQIRVFRAEVEPERFAGVVRRARACGVTPLTLLGAAYAAAVRRTFDPWWERPGDYIAVSVPRDLRRLLGREEQVGNLTYPQGIPVLGDDPMEVEPMAMVLSDRLRRGATNRVMYRHVAHALRASCAQPVPGAAEAGERLPVEDGRLVLSPLPVLGITEIPTWSEIASLGRARVLRTFFQTPMMTRRYAGGCVHLGCAIRWHPAFDVRIRAFLAEVVDSLLGTASCHWDLL